MLKAISQVQKKIKVGTHGEDYGSWMSNPVFYVFGGGTLLAAVLAVLSFTTFHSTVLGVIFTVAVVGLLAGLGWITWIRRQYAFGKGGMMEKVHQTILSNLDFDGKGQLLRLRRDGQPRGAYLAICQSRWTGLLGRDVQLFQGGMREKRPC